MGISLSRNGSFVALRSSRSSLGEGSPELFFLFVGSSNWSQIEWLYGLDRDDGEQNPELISL